MSGVGDLTTFRRSVESEGITSSGAERVPSSGVPMVMPSMVTLLSDESRPRMTTKRPSPWSRVTLTPGRRCKDSATFLSG